MLKLFGMMWLCSKSQIQSGLSKMRLFTALKMATSCEMMLTFSEDSCEHCCTLTVFVIHVWNYLLHLVRLYTPENVVNNLAQSFIWICGLLW